MRLFIPIVVLLLPALASADTTGAASVDAEITRYGTSYETIYQVNIKPETTVDVGPLALSLIVPLSTGYTVNNSCCRFGVGNLTGRVVYAKQGERMRWWLKSSVSAPTSELTDSYGHSSRVAATAAITSDAGFYLPNTTTARLNGGGELAIDGRVSMGAELGVHYWLHGDNMPDQVVLPMTVYARARLSSRLTSHVAVRNLFNTGAGQEAWLHQVSAGASYTWGVNTVGASLALPVDESLRALGMITSGVSFARSF